MLRSSLREAQDSLQREDLPAWLSDILRHQSSELQRHVAAEEQKQSEKAVDGLQGASAKTE